MPALIWRAGRYPIYASASGYVQVAGWSSGGYGNYVIIYHGSMSDGNAYSTLYGHMKSVATSAGKYVKQGELIGYVGSTGNSTGNHLHLESGRAAARPMRSIRAVISPSPQLSVFIRSLVFYERTKT